MSVFGILGEGLARIADALAPLFGTAATAAAIVLFTLAVRTALHPLARAAARGEQARAALAPQLAELQRKHKGKPERLQKATSDLYAKNGASPLAGCLPSLLQVPFFFLMYHLFSTGGDALLGHTLLGAPLGGHWSQALADGGVFGAQGLVYLGLFALIGAVATWNFRRARAAAAAAPKPAANGATAPGLPELGGMTKLLPLLSFGMLITVAVVPLAAGLYTVTSTTWTACERAWLRRDRTRCGGAEAGGTSGSGVAAGSAPGAAGSSSAAGRSSREAVQASPAARLSPAASPTPTAPEPASVGRRTAPKTRAARQRAARARVNSRRSHGGGTEQAGAGAGAGRAARPARAAD
nr:membrane protein insertase YidC [Streptomyces natalensis]